MSQPSDESTARHQAIKTTRRAGLVALGLAALVIANGAWVRLQARSEQTNWSAEQAIPNVSVEHPSGANSDATLILPGNLQAYYAAPIYARVPGYVRVWNKDIGASVRRGEVLAEIDAPEVDQQIAQARADLANAEAARKQSASTAERWTNLLKIGGVSREDAEEKTSDLAVKGAQVKSAQANLDRLLTMKTFARIVAPFDGVITERTVDIGNLVNAGAGSAGSSLFTVSDTHKIRVYVRVPQNYSAKIQNHMMADLSLPEYPVETFSAKLVSTSNAISNQSNTLLVQLEAENPKGKLKPGEYAQVSFKLPAGDGRLSIPVSALMFRGEGLQVATVGPDNHVVMKPIEIAQDLGSRVEVSTGLDASDSVIDNPPDSLRAGDVVRVAPAAARQRAESK
jgi:RND family efflux transporter MFP subunit